MIVLKKFATLFLWVFVIFPIHEARFDNGYISYKQHYNNKVKIPVKTNYNHKIQKKVNRFEGTDKHTDVESNFIFPHNNGLEMRSDNNVVSIKDPTPCANSKNFCEDPENYPQNYVNDMLNNDPTLGSYLTEHIVDLDRISDNKLCSSKEGKAWPQKAKTTNGTWMWIIQSKQLNRTQLIRYASCKKENKPCQQLTASTEFNPMCKQMDSHLPLLAFKGNKKEMAIFSLPSHCCCINCYNCVK